MTNSNNTEQTIILNNWQALIDFIKHTYYRNFTIMVIDGIIMARGVKTDYKEPKIPKWFVEWSTTFMSMYKKDMSAIHQFMNEQKKFNSEQLKFNKEQREFNARQEAFNQEVRVFMDNQLAINERNNLK